MTAPTTTRPPAVRGAAASTPTTTALAAARRRAVLEWIGVHALAVAAALFFLLPFVFVLLTAVMSGDQTLTRDLWPHTWQWSNFTRVWQTPGFLTWWRNTLLYAVLGTALAVGSSIPVAYALAKFRFRGRNAMMMAVIAMMMLPPQVVIVPMYLFWSRQMGMTGTLWPLIIPMAFGNPFTIFLLRQFLLTIPREYTEAARIDGCGEFRAMLRVVLPMAKPALAAVALFHFFYCWNDYFGPQIYASGNPGAWTLSYGLESFKGAHHTDWNLTMAATVLVIAPVIVVFFFAQKAFIEGVTLTGIKG